MINKKIALLSALAVMNTMVFADIDAQKVDATNQAKLDAIFQALPKYTIQAGSHTPAQNAAHKKYCATFGDKDITDTIDIQVGYDNIDPMDNTVFCMGEGIPTSDNFAGAVAGTSTSDSELPIPGDSDLKNLNFYAENSGSSSVQPYPINGKIPVGDSVLIWGYATWNYTLGGRPMITLKGWINGTDCLSFAQDYITGPTGHVRGNTANCGHVYGYGSYLGTTDWASLSGPNGVSSSVPGVIDIIR